MFRRNCAKAELESQKFDNSTKEGTFRSVDKRFVGGLLEFETAVVVIVPPWRALGEARNSSWLSMITFKHKPSLNSHPLRLPPPPSALPRLEELLKAALQRADAAAGTSLCGRSLILKIRLTREATGWLMPLTEPLEAPDFYPWWPTSDCPLARFLLRQSLTQITFCVVQSCCFSAQAVPWRGAPTQRENKRGLFPTIPIYSCC